MSLNMKLEKKIHPLINDAEFLGVFWNIRKQYQLFRSICDASQNPATKLS